MHIAFIDEGFSRFQLDAGHIEFVTGREIVGLDTIVCHNPTAVNHSPAIQIVLEIPLGRLWNNSQTHVIEYNIRVVGHQSNVAAQISGGEVFEQGIFCRLARHLDD